MTVLPRIPAAAPLPGADRTLASSVELTGLRYGAAYVLGPDDTPRLSAFTGFRRPHELADFFGYPWLLTELLEAAAGRIVRVRNTDIDGTLARSLLARSGLAVMVFVPVGDHGGARGAMVLGAARAPGRPHLGRLSHTGRVSRYSRLLASLSGLPARECELIGQASALHDVGKLTIADEVLSKPGPLTAEERDQVELHAEQGGVILGGHPHPLSDLAAEIARTHHERYDGGGYPHGLEGELIPLAGRIAAIADVFDALTSDRVYRPAMSVTRAAAIMRDGAGTQFDPRLLDLFLRALPRVALIRERRTTGALALPAAALG